jgi:hypothetical protein
MKTTTKNTMKGLPSRPEQFSMARNQRPQIDQSRRNQNRSLPTRSLLELLRTQTPRFFEIAEVVGKWVWLQFPEKQPSSITRLLAELGFHWNRTRQAWQHPCGTFRDRLSPVDPRKVYGSYFAADVQPN